MRSQNWKRHVLDAVRKISDKQYQKKTWFGESKDSISSPEELYCELFDDFMYDEFLESPNVNLTSIQKSLGLQLKEKMENYAKSIDELPRAEKVFNDSAWDEIRITAKKFLESFSHSKS